MNNQGQHGITVIYVWTTRLFGLIPWGEQSIKTTTFPKGSDLEDFKAAAPNATKIIVFDGSRDNKVVYIRQKDGSWKAPKR